MSRQKFAVVLPDPEKLDDPDPTVRVQNTLDALFPGWKTSRNAPDMNPGLVLGEAPDGRQVVMVRTHPPERGEAVTLSRALKVPDGNPVLHFAVANASGGDFRLVVRVGGTDILSTMVDDSSKKGHLRAYDISLQPWAGREVKVGFANEPTGWLNEAACWSDLRITANNGQSD